MPGIQDLLCKGADFLSRENTPAHLFFSVVTPERRPDAYPATVRRPAWMTRIPVPREGLVHSTGRLEMREQIIDEEGMEPDTL